MRGLLPLDSQSFVRQLRYHRTDLLLTSRSFSHDLHLLVDSLWLSIGHVVDALLLLWLLRCRGGLAKAGLWLDDGGQET